MSASSTSSTGGMGLSTKIFLPFVPVTPPSGLVVQMSALDLQPYRDGRLDLVGDRLRNFHAVVPAFHTSQLEFRCSNDQAIPRFRGHHLARQPRRGFTLGVHRQHLLLVGTGQTHLS